MSAGGGGAGEEWVGFDYAAVEAGESAEDALIDRLMAAGGITARQANALLPVVAECVERERVERAEDGRLFAETLRNVLMHVAAAGGAAVREAVVHRMAFDFRETGAESMRGYAKGWGVSPEAVSKAVAKVRARHRLALNSFNKSAADAEKYRESNRRKNNHE